MNFFHGVVLYAINLVFSLVQLVFLLRILFQLFRANANNAFCQKIAAITNPIIVPLRKIIPRTRFIDLSTLTVWVALDLIKYIILLYLESGEHLSFMQILLIIPADFIMQSTMIVFYAIIFHFIIGFVANGIQNTLTESLKILSEPALKFSRKIISPAGGFDFSYIIVLIALKVVQYAITFYIPARLFF